MYDIRHIAHALGGEVTGRDKCLVPGPNHSRRDRSLAIRVKASGLDVYSFAGDDWQTCRDYVRTKLGWADDWKPDPNKTAQPDAIGDDQERRKKYALQIWADSFDPRGTLAERYLREHRKLILPDNPCNSVIRFHRALRYTKDDGLPMYLPAMVALMRDVKSDAPVGIHRTFLDPYTGQKIDRRMLGTAKGAAVKFDPIASSLVIGEGTETVLAGREAGFTPAWALGSAGAIRHFPLLRKVRELTIAVENDPTSRAAVSACLSRYRDAGRTVHVVQSLVGSDLNDAWKAMHHG